MGLLSTRTFAKELLCTITKANDVAKHKNNDKLGEVAKHKNNDK